MVRACGHSTAQRQLKIPTGLSWFDDFLFKLLGDFILFKLVSSGSRSKLRKTILITYLPGIAQFHTKWHHFDPGGSSNGTRFRTRFYRLGGMLWVIIWYFYLVLPINFPPDLGVSHMLLLLNLHRIIFRRSIMHDFASIAYALSSVFSLSTLFIQLPVFPSLQFLCDCGTVSGKTHNLFVPEPILFWCLTFSFSIAGGTM